MEHLCCVPNVHIGRDHLICLCLSQTGGVKLVQPCGHINAEQPSSSWPMHSNLANRWFGKGSVPSTNAGQKKKVWLWEGAFLLAPPGKRKMAQRAGDLLCLRAVFVCKACSLIRPTGR